MDGFNIPAEPTQLAAFVRQVVAEALTRGHEPFCD